MHHLRIKDLVAAANSDGETLQKEGMYFLSKNADDISQAFDEIAKCCAIYADLFTLQVGDLIDLPVAPDELTWPTEGAEIASVKDFVETLADHRLIGTDQLACLFEVGRRAGKVNTLQG